MKMAETPAKKPQTMREWLETYRSRFEDAIPKNTIDVGRFITAAALEITNNPKLMKCHQQSIMRSLIESARYGLEVGRLLGQAWLIPYNDTYTYEDGSRGKVMTCHFQMGYKGLIVLARRSQTIKTITAEIVYENDIIDVELGEGRHLTHKINIREDRGEPIAYYCLVELVGGGTQWTVMTKKQMENYRDKYSKAHTKKYADEESVWDTNFDEMSLKTVCIKTLKLCPVSIEALEAARLSEIQDATGQVPMRNVTPESAPMPPENPEPEPEGEPEAEPASEPVAIPEKTSGEEIPQEKAPAAEPAKAEVKPDKFKSAMASLKDRAAQAALQEKVAEVASKTGGLKKGTADFPARAPEPTDDQAPSGLDIF